MQLAQSDSVVALEPSRMDSSTFKPHCDSIKMKNALNPIENIFSKFKALLRKAAARTIEELDKAVKEALKAITSLDCANCIAAAGYVNG